MTQNEKSLNLQIVSDYHEIHSGCQKQQQERDGILYLLLPFKAFGIKVIYRRNLHRSPICVFNFIVRNYKKVSEL
jgi:hypothetical protein